MHPANKIANLRRRVNRARNFPYNTCPASRHVQQIAESLLRNPSVQFDAEHWAGSMLAVVEALWKARTKLEKLAPTYGEDELAQAKKEADAIAAGVRVE